MLRHKLSLEGKQIIIICDWILEKSPLWAHFALQIFNSEKLISLFLYGSNIVKILYFKLPE